MRAQCDTLASLTESQHDSEPAVAECLSEGELLAFARGQLTAEENERVHCHLDDCSVCQRLVAEAVHALDTAPLSSGPDAQLSWNTVFQPGAVIAKRYRILRFVGRGGMGEVHVALDTLLNETVALKTVTATHCDSSEAMRLLRAEVQLARRITHPNVCRIFDLGTHVTESSGSEVQFLAMEYVAGESLGKKLRQGQALTIDMALSIAEQLLRGLSAAHDAGIVHRDFKSDNVMLHTDNHGNTKAVILDFGLAKVLNESGCIVSAHSQVSSAIIGTIGYMAPEQIEGKPITVASDIYAFGIVCYEMLAGRLPFQADTLAAFALCRLIQPPKAPSCFNERVPEWLDAIVLRCLERQPKDRYASAQQVLEALRSGVDTALAPSRTSPARRRLGARLRVGVGLAILGVASLAVATAPHLSARYSQVTRNEPAGVQLLPAPPSPPTRTETEPSRASSNGAPGRHPPATSGSGQPDSTPQPRAEAFAPPPSPMKRPRAPRPSPAKEWRKDPLEPDWLSPKEN